MKGRGSLFIVSAPSGAGKSSLIKSLLNRFNNDDSMRLSVSHTTRDPRVGEVNGESYHFVSTDEFKALIEKEAFYEYAQVFDNYYGTSREIVEQWQDDGYDVLFDIDWQGARIIKEQSPDAIKIFILPPSLDELHSRLVGRGQDSPEVIASRMDKAKKEISHYDEYDYILINDDFDTCLNELRSIILSTRQKKEKIIEKHGDLINSLLDGFKEE